MNLGGGAPAGDPGTPPVGTLVPQQVLHKSERTQVIRLFVPGGSKILKEPLGPGRNKRLRHEVEILERLSGVDGVVQMANTQPYARSILLEDLHGIPLAGFVMPLPIDESARLALELARVVARTHGRGVVHLDINPANILLAGADQTPCLIDFALATTFAEIRAEFTHHNEIVGTLAYLAPEQTGRTGHPVDQRADLYAVGSTLYELATGQPPFDNGDPLRLIHDHMARVPVAPVEVNPAVPPGLSSIVMHLLEKEPDNRYQSAEGLIHDLIRLRDGGAIAARRRARLPAPAAGAVPAGRAGRRDRARWALLSPGCCRAAAAECWSAARQAWVRRR